MNSELLKLCGFEPEEIRREKPRIDRAFEIWGITAEDVKQAEARIKRFFDLSFFGMRKIRGIWLKEFIDMTLAKEEGKKVVYTSFPPVAQLNGAISLMSDKVYCSVPEPVLMIVMGQYFGKWGATLLEAAEKSWLPPGQAHCPFLQARLAAILGGMIAKPDLLIAFGTLCDQVGKTDDMLSYIQDIPVVHVDSCNDEAGDQWPYPEPRRVRYLAQELKKVADTFKQVVGLEITEEAISGGQKEQSRFKSVFEKLQELRGKADPLPMREKDWANIYEAVNICAGRALREGPNVAAILIDEVNERVRQGKGVLEKGAPRVINLLPHCTDPAVTEVIENAGLATVVNVVSPPAMRLPSQYPTIWEQIADINIRLGSRSSAALYVNQLKDHCRQWNVDGMIVASVIKCRFANIYPRRTKEVIESELGVPVLAVELDSCDSREYTAERFRTRVEPFAEMLKDRKRRGSKS